MLCARFFFVMIIMLICELLNEFGIFRVTVENMRMVTVVFIICTTVPLLVCRRSSWIELPATKYLVMSCAMLEILFAMVILGQWADLCLMMPLLLAGQYHNKFMNRFVLVVTLIIAEKNPPNHLICIYADTDGLHALNDEKGHYAGDEFLKLCAKSMMDGFGEDCYRIGGDEFIAFTESMDEADVRTVLNEITRKLNEKQYHMSFGICSLQEGMGISDMIYNAEQEMYRSKNDYYLSTNKKRRRH